MQNCFRNFQMNFMLPCKINSGSIFFVVVCPQVLRAITFIPFTCLSLFLYIFIDIPYFYLHLFSPLTNQQMKHYIKVFLKLTEGFFKTIFLLFTFMPPSILAENFSLFRYRGMNIIFTLTYIFFFILFLFCTRKEKEC
jgi:hypothetical protein